MSKSDEITVTLELTQREVDALHKLTLRGARWGTPNSNFSKDVMAIFEAVSPFADSGSDCPYQHLYPNGQREFPEWRMVKR